MSGIAFGVQGKRFGIRLGERLVDWLESIVGARTIVELARHGLSWLKRQEGIGRREAQRLAEWEKLWRPKS